MRQEFKLQDPGEGVHEVDILEVLVAEGDTVKEGQNVLVVESDKAAIELPSPHSGTIAEMRVKEGDTAEVGDVLLVIDDGEGGARDDAEGDEREDDDAEEEVERAEAEDDEEEADRDEAEDDAEEAEGDEEAEVEEARAGGSEDAQDEDETEDREEDDEASEQRAEDDEKPSAGDVRKEEGAPVRASPAARKLAREHDVDLAQLDPSGGDGQVTEEDVRAALPAETEPDNGRTDTGADEGAEDEFGPIERQRVSSIRAATARAMTRSWSEIPHVHHEDAADITEFERWRQRQDDPPTLTPVVAKAVAALLPEHPRFNASFDEEAGEIVLRRYRNISFAVATDRGLVTPVVRDAGDKSIRTLAEEMAALAEKARDKKLRKADIRGGTFTITNVGGLGGRGLSPLVNPPQTAILGLARARMEPVARGSLDAPRFEARMILPMVLGFDHRVIDGADAARFMNDLVARLSDPVSLAMET